MKLTQILEAKYATGYVFIPTDETFIGDSTWGVVSYDLESGQPFEPQIAAIISKDYGEPWEEIIEYLTPPSAIWVVRKDIYEAIFRANKNASTGNDSDWDAVNSMIKALFHELSVQTIKLNWPRRNQ